MVWRHAGAPLVVGEAGQVATSTGAFREALLTQVANPKVAGFFASIFVTVLPVSPPLWLVAVILVNVFLIEAVWYAAVAVFFSAARPRAAYIRAKPAIDRIMAGFLAVLGAKLIMDALRDAGVAST